MDGLLMRELHGNLNQLSDESFLKLKNYYATGTLTLQDHYLLLSELIGRSAMFKVLKVPG